MRNRQIILFVLVPDFSRDNQTILCQALRKIPLKIPAFVSSRLLFRLRSSTLSRIREGRKTCSRVAKWIGLFKSEIWPEMGSNCICYCVCIHSKRDLSQWRQTGRDLSFVYYLSWITQGPVQTWLGQNSGLWIECRLGYRTYLFHIRAFQPIKSSLSRFCGSAAENTFDMSKVADSANMSNRWQIRNHSFEKCSFEYLFRELNGPRMDEFKPKEFYVKQLRKWRKVGRNSEEIQMQPIIRQHKRI